MQRCRDAEMSKIIDFPGGTHCADCDEQIPVRRMHCHPEATRCVRCQMEWDRTFDDAVTASGRNGIVIVVPR